MTKRADYALLALSHLSAASLEDPKRLVNTKEIAEYYEIPLELLAKVLQILAKNGIVGSHPGPSGGYRLMRSPKDISVADVVTLIDGPLSLLHCTVGEESSCKQYSKCTLRDPLGEIERRVKDLLSAISIDEISAPAPMPKFEDFSHRAFAAGLRVG